jgi:hypothetical protein
MPTDKKTGPSAPARRTKSRRHGYRGYGSGLAKNTAAYGGAVHWGRGFTGVEFPSDTTATLLESGLFSEDQKERA